MVLRVFGVRVATPSSLPHGRHTHEGLREGGSLEVGRFLLMNSNGFASQTASSSPVFGNLS